MVKDESLDVLGAGAAAGEAARYGVRGDGVVVDEDGVVAMMWGGRLGATNALPSLYVEFVHA